MKIYIAREVNDPMLYSLHTNKKDCDKWIRDNTMEATFEDTEPQNYFIKVIEFKLNKQSILHAIENIIEVFLWLITHADGLI